MIKIFGLIVLAIANSLVFAQKRPSLYQIDLIVFTHQQNAALAEPFISSFAKKGKLIHLKAEKAETKTLYHLLPFSSSQLKQEYRALSAKSQYHVLLHYSWLQPHNNKAAVQLPKINEDGWQIKGKIRIHQNNYYLLDSELSFSALNDEKSSFVFAEKQQIKGGEIYYLDHPQAGMLIKIHPVG